MTMYQNLVLTFALRERSFFENDFSVMFLFLSWFQAIFMVMEFCFPVSKYLERISTAAFLKE